MKDITINDKIVTFFLSPYSESSKAHIKEVNDKDQQLLLCIRYIILGCITNYKKLTLQESNEIMKPTTKITYITTIANNPLKIKLFIVYLLVYYIESEIRFKYISDNNKRSFVGIDYEFFQNNITVCLKINIR
jgi:hypothetical protein